MQVIGSRSGKARPPVFARFASCAAFALQVIGSRSGKARPPVFARFASCAAFALQVIGSRSGKARPPVFARFASCAAFALQVIGSRSGKARPPVFARFASCAAFALQVARFASCAAFALLVGPSVAGAQSFEGARLLGLAQSQRALTSGNDSIYVNPAGLAMAKQYIVETSYLDDFRGSDRRFNGSVLDSQAGPLAAGLAYTYTTRRPDDVLEEEDGAVRLEGHRADLSVAALVAQGAALGLNLRYLALKRLDGDQEIAGTNFNVFNLDAGLQWRFGPNLSIAVVGYNLIRNERPEMPIHLGGGLGYQAGMFSLEADFLYFFDAKNVQVSGGTSVVLGDMFPIRAGVSWDDLNDEWRLSAGLGFIVEQAGIDLGYRQSLNPQRNGDDRDDRIFGITIRAVLL